MSTLPGNNETAQQELHREDTDKKTLIATNTRPYSTPTGKNIDEFDLALDAEIERTNKAEADAEYNRKKYGQLKEMYRGKESYIKELLSTIEYKNEQLARLQRRDHDARVNEVSHNNEQRNFATWVENRFLTGATPKKYLTK